MKIGEDSDRVSLEISDGSEQVLLVDLPESLVVVLEEAFAKHLGRIGLSQVGQDLSCVAHPHHLGFFERVHERVLVGLERLLKRVGVLDLTVFVVELDTPRNALFLLSKAEQCVELNADGHVPPELLTIEREPHLVIAIHFVLWGVCIEHSFDFGEEKIEVIFSWGHNLHAAMSAGMVVGLT